MIKKLDMLNNLYNDNDEENRGDYEYEDIVPIIDALLFLKGEAKKMGNDKATNLINACFEMNILVCSMLLESKSRKN